MRSSQAAIASARAGLEMAWESLQWQGEAGTGSLREALVSSAPPLHSATLHGRGAARPAAWQVPYRGSVLRGSALAAQIDDWLARGIIESSAAVALHRCLKNPEWFDLSDRTMVLLGAGSEAGPLRWLASWRARIVAVDIPAEPVWRRIAAIVADGNGVLLAPVRRTIPAQDGEAAWLAEAGVDLLTETPQVAAWVCAQRRSA